jgi:cytochrome c peroxidase
MMRRGFSALSVSFLFLIGCNPEAPVDSAELDSTPHVLAQGHFPNPVLSEDNPLTESGVALGRMLFHEKRLSGDNTQACADCHSQAQNFSDVSVFSTGIAGEEGTRHSMILSNLAWHVHHDGSHVHGFFWDGRAPTLRDQVLQPIQDELEMNASLEEAMAKLEAMSKYRDQFMRAFGTEEVTEERMAKALEQFLLTLISNQSRYDQWLLGEASLTLSEDRGRALFFDEFDPFNPELSGADCAHCHSGLDFSSHQFGNNGLDAEGEMLDIGLMGVSGSDADLGKFKVPSLRNVMESAPYMHDGRFTNIEDVLDHYDHGVQLSSTLDPMMQYNVDYGLGLTEEDQADLIAFLHTLTDPVFLSNPAFSSPH